MKPWVLYTRVSTSKQADHGASLDAQLAACAALAKAHEYRTIHVADEGESAKDVAQPGLAKVKAMAAHGEIAGVMVYKLDRVARNTRGLLDLLEGFSGHGVQFTSVREHIDTSGAAGRLIVTVLAALAQFEREQLAERVRATNEHKRAQGAWVAGAAPVGLDTEPRGKLRYLIPHPLWGPPVSMAWKLVLEGKTLAEVCTALNALNVPTTGAKRRQSRRIWARNAVSAMLANPTYMGVLVSEDDFERVRVLLGARPSPRKNAKAPRPERSERVWRLAGLAVCARCDSTIIAHTAISRGNRFPYLRCTGRLHRGKSFCSAKDLPAETWEDKVVSVVASYLGNREGVLTEINRAVERRKREAGPARERADALRAQRDDIRARLDRALAIALEGGATARAVAPRLASLQSDLEGAERELAIAEGVLAGAEIPMASLEQTASILATMAEGLTTRRPEDQQMVLKSLRTRARLAADTSCEVTISIPYLGDPGSLNSQNWLPLTAVGEPITAVSMPMDPAAFRPRRWYRRPTQSPPSV